MDWRATGELGAVARDDIADVAVAVMLSDEHDGYTYDVTGSETITLHQVAAELSRITGHSITYHAETIEEAYASRVSYGSPEWEVEGWVTTLYAAIATGEMDGVSDTVSKLTGHAPMTFADFLRKPPESYRHLLNSR